MRSVASISSCC